MQDNDTEEGREANRRIEFRLIRPAPSVQEGETMLETIAETSNTPQSENTQPSEGETDEQN